MNAFGLNGDEDQVATAPAQPSRPFDKVCCLSDRALALLRELSSTRGKARIGRRSRALAKLLRLGLVERDDRSGDARAPWWPLTAAGRREVERRRKR